MRDKQKNRKRFRTGIKTSLEKRKKDKYQTTFLLGRLTRWSTNQMVPNAMGSTLASCSLFQQKIGTIIFGRRVTFPDSFPYRFLFLQGNDHLWRPRLDHRPTNILLCQLIRKPNSLSIHIYLKIYWNRREILFIFICINHPVCVTIFTSITSIPGHVTK